MRKVNSIVLKYENIFHFWTKDMRKTNSIDLPPMENLFAILGDITLEKVKPRPSKIQSLKR